MVRTHFGYRDYRKLLKRLQGLLAEGLGGELVGLALFGSVARGTARKHSDIDLLVVLEGNITVAQKVFVKAVMKLRRTREYQDMLENGYIPDPFPIFIDVDRLKTHPWILLDIVDHGIILKDNKKILRNEFRQIKKRLRGLGSRKVVLEDGGWYWDLKPDWRPGEVIEI